MTSAVLSYTIKYVKQK